MVPLSATGDVSGGGASEAHQVLAVLLHSSTHSNNISMIVSMR